MPFRHQLTRPRVLITERLPRVLIIGALPPPQHGVTGMNEILLRELRQLRQFDIRHVDTSDRRPISTVERLDLRNVLAALQHGVQTFVQLLFWRPDVVYVPVSQKSLGFLRDALFLVPATLLGRSTVVHLHGGNLRAFYEGSGRMMKWLIRFCLSRTSRAIVLGESLRPAFAGLVAADRIVVVPNGIPDLAPDLPRDKPRTGDRLRVLYLGTLALGKGIEVFVRSCLAVLNKTDEVDFIVAGSWWRGADRDRVQSLLASSPRHDGIRFIGEVSGAAKAELLRSMDVLVFPSIQEEGLPLTVVEAMCAGLAVIASDRGCIRETVVEGQTGFIVSPGDVAGIATKLLEFAADRSSCERLGRAGRDRYEQRHRDDVFGERMAGVLREAAFMEPRG